MTTADIPPGVDMLLDEVRSLPVIADLLARYGQCTFGHLAGEPVRLRDKIRMVWVWFVDGQNFNLAIDRANLWTVRCSGPAGWVQWTGKIGQPLTDGQLRGVAVAAGLLGPPPVPVQVRGLARANRERSAVFGSRDARTARLLLDGPRAWLFSDRQRLVLHARVADPYAAWSVIAARCGMSKDTAIGVFRRAASHLQPEGQ